MKRRLVPFLIALGAVFAFVGVASATTGSINGLPQPNVYVPYGKAFPFEGRFELTEVGRGANLRSGEMKIEFPETSSPKFLAGYAAFYQYNSLGQTETALFALYPFRPTKDGVSALVRNQGLNGHLGETLKVGKLDLFEPKSEDRLEGELEYHGGTYQVVYKRLPDDSAVAAKLEPAKQLTETKAQATTGGWSKDPAEYEGGYELTNPAPDPTAGAGVLAPVIGVAQGLGTIGTTLSSGSLEVSGNDAIAKLNTGETDRTYFLTDFSYEGNLKLAEVHEGSPTSKVVGKFEGRLKGDVLKGSLEAGDSRYQVEFTRNG